MARATLARVPAALALAAAALVPAAAGGAGLPGTVDLTVPADRSTDAVVLTGRDLMVGTSSWAVPENLTLAIPSKDAPCFTEKADTNCGPEAYNHYVEPDLDTAALQDQLPVKGTPTGKLLGYRWHPNNGAKGGSWQQIPFQVDEVFTRYLNNDYSDFGIYSGTDKHTTYAFDREGFRFTENDPADPCQAAPKDGVTTTPDPVKGLDSNDELAFMASDAGPQAPAGTALPKHVAGAKLVTILDPTSPQAQPRYVYVMRADDSADAPKPAFDASNGYVRYERDADADRLAFSRSSYGGYGPAIQGPYCENGEIKTGPRKPLDTATIRTSRYLFHYDGRWLMTRVQIAQTPQDPWHDPVYGPDLVDRWKARAFAQDPGSVTPCCGYEEEDTNWGGSSSLLGEKVGPVRAIRETWGADSGTNVIRRETFYRDRMTQKTWLRVHVIPPLDGIYAQWDFNAGRMTTFFNANNPGGVPIDGRNDEVYGNFDDPCNPRWDDNERTQIDSVYRQAYQASGLCAVPGISDNEHASIDPGDLTFADANASLGWSETAGPYGTIVDRIHATPTDLSPGGAVQSLAAVPYYRDDACFDDGTGSDPGPELHPRHFDEEQATGANGARRCWTAADGQTHGDADAERGDPRFWQGDIGTHGLHLLFLVDSDNARTTVPLTEIVSDWDLVMLPPSEENQGNVGEKYGRPLEKPLVAVVSDQG